RETSRPEVCAANDAWLSSRRHTPCAGFRTRSVRSTIRWLLLCCWSPGRRRPVHPAGEQVDRGGQALHGLVEGRGVGDGGQVLVERFLKANELGLVLLKLDERGRLLLEFLGGQRELDQERLRACEELLF